MKNFLRQISVFLVKVPEILRRHYFVILLVVLACFVGWGVYFFWQFGIHSVRIAPENPPEKSGLDDEIFEKVKASVQLREKSLSSALTKEYPDIFR